MGWEDRAYWKGRSLIDETVNEHEIDEFESNRVWRIVVDVLKSRLVNTLIKLEGDEDEYVTAKLRGMAAELRFVINLPASLKAEIQEKEVVENG